VLLAICLLLSVWPWSPIRGAILEAARRPRTKLPLDRPYVTTNSSLVVPFGSLQNENGLNLSSPWRRVRTFDGKIVRGG